ncbi:MAG: hypothetical protein VB108_00065 [Anaerolineaceae bacterium]|nr:hypothetical protein [Anaerolineaceae bacterium]
MDEIRIDTKTKRFLLGLLIFCLAFLLRILHAQQTSFTRPDADLAWQALQISRGLPAGTSFLPLYTGLTAVLFWLGSASNFIARFLPAFFGASLTLIPFVIFNERDMRRTLLGALILCLDPVLLAYSRQIAGPVLAMSALAWALVFFYQGKSTPAGICLALALLSGKYFWISAFLLGLLFLYCRFIQHNPKPSLFLPQQQNGKTLWLSFLIASGLVASSFFLNPSGLTGLASGFVALFQAKPAAGLPFILPPFLLFTYSLYLWVPLAVVLAKASAKTRMFDLAGIVFLLLLCMALQNLLPGLFAFLQIYLIILLVKNLPQSEIKAFKKDWVTLASFIFFTVILVFALLSFKQMVQKMPLVFSFAADLLPLLLALLLIAISYVLIGLGWGFNFTKPAILAALTGVTLLFSLSFTFSQVWYDATASHLLFSNAELLFPDGPMKNELAIFTQSKRIIAGVDSFEFTQPASEGDYWEFRAFGSKPEPEKPAAFLINDSPNDSGHGGSYRGSKITYARRLNFSDKPLIDLLHMIAAKTLPYSEISRTLWVQTKLFPGD